MIIDEVSGHSWLTMEHSFRFTDAQKEAVCDEKQIQRMKEEARQYIADAKGDKHRYCSFVLKSMFGDKTTVKVLATARLYRKTGEKV
jgi:hypothetical protein